MLRRLRSTGAPGRAAGPVPWIHWRSRSGGISAPSKRPARASATEMVVRGMMAAGSRNPIGVRAAARAARRAVRARISSTRSRSNGASASIAARAAGVKTSA